MKIVFATSNLHKLQEINAIAEGLGITFVLPEREFSPEENGSTFEENSLIKAKAANALTGKMSLADDSGLCVDALNGAPGLYSARYAGSQQEKIDKLLTELEGIENRSAKFICAMTLVDERGELVHSTLGECFGEIVTTQRGVNGFGYDPIFKLQDSDLTMAELSEFEKNKISHRANALNKMLDFLRTYS